MDINTSGSVKSVPLKAAFNKLFIVYRQDSSWILYFPLFVFVMHGMHVTPRAHVHSKVQIIYEQ